MIFACFAGGKAANEREKEKQQRKRQQQQQQSGTMAYGHNPYHIALRAIGQAQQNNKAAVGTRWLPPGDALSTNNGWLRTYGGERLTQLCCWEPARTFNRSSSSNSSESFKTLFGEESKHYRCCDGRGHMHARCLLLDNAPVQAVWVGGEERGWGGRLCMDSVQPTPSCRASTRPKIKISLPSIGHGKSGAR